MAQWLDYRPSPLVTPARAVAAVKASGKTHITATISAAI
jgi:hypothetical protein